MAGRHPGGAETYSADMMLSLHAAGVDQVVVTPRSMPRFADLKAAGIRLEPGLLRWPIRPLRRWALARLIDREKPDLIHTWMRRAAGLVDPRERARTLGWFGGYYNPKHFRACGNLIGVTPGIVQHMIAEGVSAATTHFVPTFPNVRDEPPVARVALNTPPDAFVVLALSRYHPKKGLDTLLQAVQALPDVHLWLAGEGPLRRDLEKQARRLGLGERAHFLGWRSDRSALLRSADVCALPSRYEPFGTVILEAWAAKTPLVASMSAGPAAHVRDGKDGLLVPIDAVQSLQSAIMRLRADPTLRTRLAEAGHAKYLAHYTREAVTRRMLEVYERVRAEAAT